MNIILFLYIFTLGLLYINQVYSKTIYEINVIPINSNIFQAGVNNQIRISLWSKTINFPVSLEVIESVDNSLIDVMIFSKDLRAFSQFHMEDFPHYNNETNLPSTANYFDIDYVFPIAGDYTISIKCKPYKKSIRVNQDIHVEGKKEAKMNVDNSILPFNPKNQKVIYFKPVQLENIKSIYYLPIIPHTLTISKKDLVNEVSKATGPIYGTKFTIRHTLKPGYCSSFVLEFFRVELKDGKIHEVPVKDLFQYNNVPIKAILANQENPDFDIIQGNILNTVSDDIPSCGSKIEPPTEMVYGPIFGFSVPFRKFGLYHIIFEISHSFNDNTYLLTPDIVLRVAEEDEEIKYAPDNYIDDDTNYDQFINDVINKQKSIPDADENDDKNSTNDDKDAAAANENKDNDDDDKTNKDDNTDDAATDENKDGDDKNDKDTNDTDDATNEDKDGDDDDKNDKDANDADDDATNENKDGDDKNDKDANDADDATNENKDGDDKVGEDNTKETNSSTATDVKEIKENSDTKEVEISSTKSSSETTSIDPDDQEIQESTKGKIIILGVAGIITISGLM